MAGDIVEPSFRLNYFQGSSLHTGSISFGRFENEVLCWERRSSFSHNRHREEVEKYSRPGSVSVKKAYFEAHFRNRALVKQSSSASQNRTGYKSSEVRDNLLSDGDGSHSSVSDDSSVGPMKAKEFDEPDCVTEHYGTSYSEPPSTSPISLEVPDCEHVNSTQIYQARVETSAVKHNEQDIGVPEISSDKIVTLDMKFIYVDSTTSSHDADISVGSGSQKGPSYQRKDVSQTRQTDYLLHLQEPDDKHLISR